MESSKIKILAIDDNKDNLVSIKALIHESFPDALIFIALSGVNGIELAIAENPDVILLDIVMPEMDGFEVCKRIKADKVLSSIPVVFVTANKVDKASRICALECGAEAFLAKPIDQTELTAQIRSMVKIKAAINQKQDENKRLEALVEERTREIKIMHISTLELLEDLKKENESRKKSEQALYESEEHFRSVTQSATDSIITINSKGIITGWNNGAERIFGYTDEEVLSKHLNLLVPNRYYSEHVKGIERVVQGGEHHVIGKTVELYGFNKSGNEFPIELSLSEWETTTEKFFTGIIRDISSRKQAEAKLIESESFLKETQTIANLGTYSFDISANKWESSELLDRIFGIETNADKTFLGWISIIHPDWQITMNDYFINDVVGARTKFDKEYKIIRRNDQSERWVHGMGNLKFNDHGFPIVMFGTIQDITHRKLVEIKLKESEEKFSMIFEKAPALISITDYYDGTYIDVNDFAVRFSGFSREEIIGKNSFEIGWITEENRNLLVKTLTEKGKIEGLDLSFKTKNGKIVYGTVSGEKVIINNQECLLTITTDITDRIEAESQLKLLNRVVEQSPVTVVITDKAGNIQYANPVFTTITGYSIEEVMGKNLRILSSGIHSKDFYESLWSTILSGNFWNGEFCNLKKNGQTYWESAVISPILDSHGTICSFVAVKEDITEKKKLMRNLIKAKEKAEESDRLKSAFLANMSHEIRTPMNGILGFADLLKEPKLSGEEKLEYIEIIEKSGKRMLNIINDIVDISKIESGQMKVNIQDSNINDQLEYIFTFFKPEVEGKGIKFSFECTLPSKESIIKTDREKVFAILTNLVKNAIKFCEKGSIEFGYILKTHSESAELKFYVKDTGIGIPKDRQEAIFERFIQADIGDKRAFQGAGLGLSITKAYVEKLGGKIWVDSVEGIGSTFYFTLPYTTEPVGKIIDGNTKTTFLDEYKKKPLKILIAEDDKESAKYLEIIVRNISTEIISVRTGIEAVELCKLNPDINLVLMDIQIPVMDGYEATRQIRKFNTKVVIVGQTAFALNGDKEKAIAAGCSDYITKPIQKEQLVFLLKKYF